MMPEKRTDCFFVDVAKVFFGSCLQLCFQLVLLVGYTNPDDRELSQYLSIAASSYLLCKTGVDIILFRRSTDEEENEQKKRLFNYLYLILTDTLQNISFTPQKTCLEKLKAFIKHFLIEQFQKMKILLFYLPLVTDKSCVPHWYPGCDYSCFGRVFSNLHLSCICCQSSGLHHFAI